ncbi:hypothetical protein ACFU9B_41220 [Streptomyces sp. NPDC057592]|uniref:hypothetical protein n=1 Tax=unclassified Streptomyces TaxID=2593676 RepID=UPI00367B9F8D
MTCTGTAADADQQGLAAQNWPTGKRRCRGGEHVLVQLQRQRAGPYRLTLVRVRDPLHEPLHRGLRRYPEQLEYVHGSREIIFGFLSP